MPCIILSWSCIADCEEPVSDAKLNYSSTLEGSVLILICENDTSTDEQSLSATCHSNGNWIPDPAQFTCSSSITVPTGTEILIHSTPHSSGSKININFITPSTTVHVYNIIMLFIIIVTAVSTWFN